MVKHSDNIQPLNVMGSSLIINQLADDTTLLKDAAQVPQALNVRLFLIRLLDYLHLKKCELMTIHDHPPVSIEGIAVKKRG